MSYWVLELGFGTLSAKILTSYWVFEIGGKKFTQLLTFRTWWKKILPSYWVLELGGRKFWQVIEFWNMDGKTLASYWVFKLGGKKLRWFIEFWNFVRKNFDELLSFGSWWEKIVAHYWVLEVDGRKFWQLETQINIGERENFPIGINSPSFHLNIIYQFLGRWFRKPQLSVWIIAFRGNGACVCSSSQCHNQIHANVLKSLNFGAVKLFMSWFRPTLQSFHSPLFYT